MRNESLETVETAVEEFLDAATTTSVQELPVKEIQGSDVVTAAGSRVRVTRYVFAGGDIDLLVLHTADPGVNDVGVG